MEASEHMYVYSDETWHPHENIQAICLIWWEQVYCEAFSTHVKELLAVSSVKEIKFARLRRNKEHTDACTSVLKLLGEYVAQGKLSIRCVVDHYGNVSSIKDMYRHVFGMIESNSRSLNQLNFRPDQKNAMRWWRADQIVHPLINVLDMHIRERSSTEEPLIQLCDLLAWLARDMVAHRWAYLMYLRYADQIAGTIRNIDKVIKTRAHIAKIFLTYFRQSGVVLDFARGYLQSSHQNCYFWALTKV